MTPMPPARPKLSTADAKAKKAARLVSLRLQMLIHRALDERGVTTPAALELPAAEATTLLSRKHLRGGDLERLKAAAARVELVPPLSEL